MRGGRDRPAVSRGGEGGISSPGSRATTIHIPGFLNSLPRWLLKLPCRLSRFLLSILCPVAADDGSTSTSSAVWPMPLPYPEAFRGGGSNIDQFQALHLKRLICLQVVVLDWLHLGEVDRAPACLKIGSRLSARQWSTVRMLEHLVVDGNTPKFVESDDMGRAASKFENFEDVVAGLARSVSALHEHGYSRLFKRQPAEGDQDRPMRCGKPCGSVPGGVPCTARPLAADRLTFPEEPCFKPNKFFDVETLRLYEHPILSGQDPTAVEPAPPVRVLATRDERVRVYKRMFEAGMLKVVDFKDIRPLHRSGLFSVVKDAQRDRLILDSRPANMCDGSQRRWCKAMASADSLSGLFIEPSRDLECSGEDLKDFFYQFSVNYERLCRNAIADRLARDEAVQVFGGKPEDYPRWVYFGLSSLAMGDTNACEFAQCSHIALCLQRRVAHARELISLKGAVPRGLLHVGIIIDDLVILEQVLRAGQPHCEGPDRVSRAQEAYKEVRLPNNPKKAFLREKCCRFWGVEIDGSKGLLRASSLRAWPLSVITMRVCTLGLCTVGLLDALAGCWVSIYGLRRRMFCLLDCNFEPLAVREMNTVIRLSDVIISELVCLAVLSSLAVVNLRADFSTRVHATDASLSCLAGVQADIPWNISREVGRHCLKRGIWSRLLPAGKALLRQHGILEPHEEIGDEDEECYTVHPLWEVLARCLTYRENWRLPVRRKRHINVLELKAYTTEERRVCSNAKSLRVPFGLDSQVVLGCCVKGRSSSLALNAELRRTMCYPIGADVYPLFMYFSTDMNRADGPSRNSAPDPPDRELPDWWASAIENNFDKFDKWLGKLHSVDDHEVQYDELCCGDDLDLAPNRIARRRRRSSQLSPCNEPAKVVTCDSGSTKQESNGELCREARDLLETFPLVQFFHSGEKPDFSKQGALDLFSGCFGVARQMMSLGAPWILTFEWRRSSSEDLLCVELRDKLVRLLRLRAFLTVGAAPICSSFSLAVTPPVRSKQFPRGIPSMRKSMRLKVKEGNSHNDFVIIIVDICIELDIFFFIENPDGSFWWKQKKWRRYSSAQSGEVFRLCFCRLGTPWKKPTRVATNTRLAGLRLWCQCKRPHVVLRGNHPVRKIPWTLVAQPYPRGLNRLLAAALCVAAGWAGPERLNVAMCAKLGSLRAGEASNPGPRRSASGREGTLEGMPSQRPETLALEARLVRSFLHWCGEILVTLPPEEIFDMSPEYLGLCLRAYGDLMYQRGGALSNLRHLILGVQRWKPNARLHLHRAWEIVERWEAVIPVNHRVPVPEAIVKALCCYGWMAGWYAWVGGVLLSFYGAGRLGEILLCTREDLLLSADAMDDANPATFLRLRRFKSLRRQPAKIQHMKVDDKVAVSIIDKVFSNMDLDQPLFNTTHYQFRKRWDMALEGLGIPPSARLTPGGMRGGAAVYHYRRGRPVSDILWLMRLRHQQTLESYLQEVSALNTVAALPASAKSNVKLFSSIFPCIAA